MGRSAVISAGLGAAFIAGLCSHMLYLRWNPPAADSTALLTAGHELTSAELTANQSHVVRFIPSPQLETSQTSGDELPLVIARDVDKIRALAGHQARIRGRVFRVGHSAKSNTYFLNFGPSREALTAVIFASGVERFEKSRRTPKSFENKEVELLGQIKDHPQYGLEIVLEDPQQIKILP
jgi:hypothetical protein